MPCKRCKTNTAHGDLCRACQIHQTYVPDIRKTYGVRTAYTGIVASKGRTTHGVQDLDTGTYNEPDNQ